MIDEPRYPQFRDITIEDKPLFQATIAQSPPQISEHTFTNLFIWNYYYHFLWCRWDDCICIIARPDGKPPFLMPPLGAGITAERLLNLLRHIERMEAHPSMQRVPERLVTGCLSGHDPFVVTPDRDNSDYVYRTEDLVKLEGNKYHGKKNHINKFKKHHRYEYSPLTPELVEQCLALEAQWCDIRHCALYPGLAGEERAIYEGLTNMSLLDFKGGVILVDGKVEAFALGELLNPETAVIHVEKANPAFDGLYQLINQEFCAHEWAGIPYVNREQDLGEEGLRKAKLSYHPHHLVNKYTVTLSENNREGI
jgi:hypothetical protein